MGVRYLWTPSSVRHRARDGGIRRRSKTLTPTSTGDSDGFARNTPSTTTATIVPASLRLHQNANETVTFKRQSEICYLCVPSSLVCLYHLYVSDVLKQGMRECMYPFYLHSSFILLLLILICIFYETLFGMHGNRKFMGKGWFRGRWFSFSILFYYFFHWDKPGIPVIW